MTRRNPIIAWLDERPTWLTISISFLLLLGAWQLLVYWGDYPPFILPGPVDVAAAFVQLVSDGRLARHTLVTLSEVIPGLVLGVIVALPLAYLLTKSPLAERLISPYHPDHRRRSAADYLGAVVVLVAGAGGGAGRALSRFGQFHRRVPRRAPRVL